MDDLKFPKFDTPLPPPKPWPTDVYAKWVLEQLEMMRRDGRSIPSASIPTGKRFTLFPKD
ncbi:MAG: hypothetical protein HY584_04505 [Candidatus Omnitrophica bacterium]|nr:hypothetical protein [Candidatus Omnitrophota bacterium]